MGQESRPPCTRYFNTVKQILENTTWGHRKMPVPPPPPPPPPAGGGGAPADSSLQREACDSGHAPGTMQSWHGHCTASGKPTVPPGPQLKSAGSTTPRAPKRREPPCTTTAFNHWHAGTTQAVPVTQYQECVAPNPPCDRCQPEPPGS
jgi:hypothetical protein